MEEYLKNPIKSWAEDDRPREKLMLKGASALSNAELIAILIGSGNAGESAVDLSQRILRESNHNLIDLSRKSIADLKKFKGIGEAKAITIAAALELGRRRQSESPVDKPIINSSDTAWKVLLETLSDNNFEKFCILLLSRANKVLRTVVISEGGLTGTVVDPKKIFKIALDHNAASIILGHNHPSGQLKPSKNDIDITKKLIHAGDLLECPVLDHIIVGDHSYFSFADEGLMTR